MEIKRRLERPWIRWEGSPKQHTKDCDGCEWYREVDGKEMCGWGVAFKYLVGTEKPRKCEVRNRTRGHDHSAEYLDELVQGACA